jgi:hypothetical protein
MRQGQAIRVLDALGDSHRVPSLLLTLRQVESHGKTVAKGV